MAKKRPQPIRRLSESQLNDLNSMLDRSGEGNHYDERREFRRFEYRLPQVLIEISHPGGGTSSVSTGTRNLSAGGLAFIYWGFLHEQTGCDMTMKTRSGMEHTVKGKVVSCRHVSGTYHLIGVKFDSPIDPWLFFGRMDSNTLDKPEDGATLIAHALYIGSQREDLERIATTINNTQFELTVAEDMPQVVSYIKDNHFDVIIYDINLNDSSAPALVSTIHALAPSQPIAVISERGQGVKNHGIKAGAQAVVCKPFTDDQLLKALMQCLSAASVDDNLPAIPSRYSDNKKMLDSIQGFIDQCAVLAEHIHQAVVDNDLHLLRQMCRQIQDESGEFGFPAVSETAGEALRKLGKSRSAESALSELNHLVALCRKMTIADPPG